MWFALWQAVTLPGPYVPYLKTADMVGNYRLLQNIHLKMTQFAAVNVRKQGIPKLNFIGSSTKRVWCDSLTFAM